MQSKPTSPKLTQSLSLHDALRLDRHRLKRIRHKISDEDYWKQLSRSVEAKRARQDLKPILEYSADLPIADHRDELVKKIQQHDVLVVCGETGSGKSTQLPKLCLEAGLGRDGMIGHTQPRRLAARSIASRVSQELGSVVGEMVGYKVRFGDQTGPKTLIKLMTDGILLAETQTDRNLDQYDVLIIDEAHERSLNIDFLLGYLKNLLRKRSDLKIIITSATIDAERFANHFEINGVKAPIISVEGRGYPVEIQYLPWDEDESRSTSYDLPSHVISALETLAQQGSGDTLIFLPTEREIREVSHQVASHYKRLGIDGRYELLPLYARLPQSQQQKIFSPDRQKIRIIFATNVAESSLTVPGIRYVIDSGTARISRYNPRLKVQRLPIEPVSQASANQRAGRCGRLGPGICVRLYSESDFDSRSPYTTPEIQRANLASVILQLKSLKLGSIEAFPLLDPPKPNAINDGLRTLRELNAIDDNHSLTSVGRRIARLPVDPRVARILIEARENQCLAEVLPIAAALEIQDPRERPIEKQQAADECHASFTDSQSDFLSLLKLWKYYGEIRSSKSRNQITKILRRQFLSPNRMREWGDVYRQLKKLMMEEPKPSSSDKGNHPISSIRYQNETESIVTNELYEKIHQSLLAGLLSGVALSTDKRDYVGAGGLKLRIWPGSSLASSSPKWIVASEIIETSNTFARIAARIKPDWIEHLASHLIKRSYSDPHWSKKRGSAFCYEAQHLFGLPIVLRRRVPLSPIDPTNARDLLIDQGLAEDQLRSNALFLRNNRSLLQSLSELASRTRNRDLIVDNYQIAQIYRDRLPENVIDRASLEKYDRQCLKPAWAKLEWTSEKIAAFTSKKLRETNPVQSIFFHPTDFIESDQNITETDFPSEIEISGSRLPLEYSYMPGSSNDGIRLKVHQSTVSQLSEDQLEWMVPGIFVEKIVQLIKSLPKRLRRNFVPAAETAKVIAQQLMSDHGKAPFFPTVCKALSQFAETEITKHDFQQEKIEEYLRFLITVVDDSGETIAENRELSALQESLPSYDYPSSVSQTHDEKEPWSCTEVTDYEIDSIPVFVMKKKGGMSIRLFPGWVDHGSSISTELFSTQSLAERSIRNGTARLFCLAEKKEIRSQIRHLPDFDLAKIKLGNILPAKSFDGQLMTLLSRIAFVENEAPIRSREEFNKRKSTALQRISGASQELARWLHPWTEKHFHLRSLVEEKSKWLQDLGIYDSINDQLIWLYDENFLINNPWKWLVHYPRYLEAVTMRIDRVTHQSNRNNESENLINDLWNRWLNMYPEDQRNASSQADNEFRWMIEELRVSLFAQSLGTSVKVSPQRCEKLLESR